MKAIPREKVEGVLERFATVATEQSILVPDSGQYVKTVLTKALGEDKANLLLDRILEGGDVAGIDNLKWMEPGAVAELLRHEIKVFVGSSVEVGLRPEGGVERSQGKAKRVVDQRPR